MGCVGWTVRALAILLFLLGQGCMFASDEELEIPALLEAGDLSLAEYPLASRGLSSAVDLPNAGGTIERSGELTSSDPIWRRPNGWGCSEVVEGRYAMDSFRLRNPWATRHRATLNLMGQTAGVGTLEDPMLFVYRGSQVPDDPLTCYAADDNNLNGRDATVTIWLDSHAEYQVVTTSVSEAHVAAGRGTYQLQIINHGP